MYRRTFAQKRVAVFEVQPLVLRHDCFRISQIVQQECVHVGSQLGGMGSRRGKHVAWVVVGGGWWVVGGGVSV